MRGITVLAAALIVMFCIGYADAGWTTLDAPGAKWTAAWVSTALTLLVYTGTPRTCTAVLPMLSPPPVLFCWAALG